MHIGFKVPKVLIPTNAKSVPVLYAICDVSDTCVHAIEYSHQKHYNDLKLGIRSK